MYSNRPYADTAFGGAGAPLFDADDEAAETAVAPTGFYGKLQRSASKLLGKRKTGVVKLIRTARAATGDVLAPWDITETLITRNSVVTGFSDKVIDGSRILASDRRIVMDAANLTERPKTQDLIDIDDERHTIMDVKPIPAAGTTVVYIIQARTSGPA